MTDESRVPGVTARRQCALVAITVAVASALALSVLLVPRSATAEQAGNRLIATAEDGIADEIQAIPADDNTSNADAAGNADSSDSSDDPSAPNTETVDEPDLEAGSAPVPSTPGTSDPIPEVPESPEDPYSTPWPARVSALAGEIAAKTADAEQADALYHELAAELWAYQEEVYEALRTRSADALDRRKKLTEMYGARVRLLEVVTTELRMKLTGGGSTGMRELVREFENAKLDFFFQTLAIPRGLRHILDDARESPLDDLWRLLELLFGVVVFRTWRRWAKTGLPDIRQAVLNIRPRTDIHLHAARLIWYLNRFRAPLEWLALLIFASAIFDAGDLEEVSTLVWVVVLWMLLTRFGLLLVDALASRSVDGPSSQNPGLRLRSLRLVAAWILLTGLGLDLTYRYVGEAAIHTWATRAFTFLLVPISLVLLHWWRTDIILRLKNDSAFSKTARKMGKREKGLGSYVRAAAGASYILSANLLQFSIRVASRFEAGRRLVATLLRREVERESTQERVAEKPISEELEIELLTPDDSVMEGPFRDGIDRIKKLSKTGRGATVAVVAERGGGLSTFLRLLKSEVGESMRIVDCPPSGPERFSEALTSEFGLDPHADLNSELRPYLSAEGIRIVAIDNYHRLARPKRGGLAGMEYAATIANSVGDDIFWIVSLTRASWPYIKGMLGDRAITQEIIELPAWSEAQLEQFFDARCKKAGIEPDYRRLVFPRQFDDGERTTLEERNRFGFRRVLWELSDGNPEVAIRLFATSLRELPSGNLIVRLPQPASSDKIASSNRTTMLILKVLIETEMATIDDLEESIRVPRDTVVTSLAHCRQEGWVEEIYDHHQITWAAYRTVKRVLIRRGLIAR